jgi:hypothetical protein
MNSWHGYTPDGRELSVLRERDDTWVVQCGTNESRNRILDVAMIEAIRTSNDLVTHSRPVDYAAWVRAQAARIEEELDEAGDTDEPSR